MAEAERKKITTARKTASTSIITIKIIKEITIIIIILNRDTDAIYDIKRRYKLYYYYYKLGYITAIYL